MIWQSVALLAEGVDRNPKDYEGVYSEDEVALLAEGVDRNGHRAGLSQPETRSPSSRRAWIEMVWCFFHGRGLPVALLAEGVDRNLVIT